MSGWPVRRLRPDRHHGRRHLRDLLGLPGRRPPSARSSRCSPTRGCPAASTQAATTSTPPRPAAWTRATRPRLAAPSTSGIEHIAAYSPQARGRRNPPEPPGQGTQPRRHHRDRGRKPLHRLPDHNRRQQSPSSKPAPSCHRLRPTRSTILCLHTKRVVAHDNTVRHERRVLQIPASPVRHHYVKATVRVHEYPDGTLALFHGPRCLARYGSCRR